MSTVQTTRRRVPFAVAVIVLVLVTVAVFRLPELFVEQVRRNRFLTSGQAGWVFRLLLAVAIGQAVYVGLSLLRPEKIASDLFDKEEGPVDIAAVAASLSRNAATMSVLPLVYGLASTALTGERAGFWAFVGLTVATTAWNYRQTGASIGRLQERSGTQGTGSS